MRSRRVGGRKKHADQGEVPARRAVRRLPPDGQPAKGAADDDDLDDIEAILRKRGIQ